MSVLKMTDLDLSGKRVLIREDLNVPVKDGQVTSDARIRASLPTIELALKAGAKVMVMSHLGRPTEGEYEEEIQPGTGCGVHFQTGCSVPVPAGERLAGWWLRGWPKVSWCCWKTYASMPVRRKMTKPCLSRWLRCVMSM